MAAYDRYVTPEGQKLNGRTLAMLNEAEHLLGEKLLVTQGGYNKGKVAASAGTHDKGGVIDLRYNSGKTTIKEKVTALRRVGFAAWYRKPSQGPWPNHIHAVAMGDKELAPLAAQQVVAYKQGFNGLGHLGQGGKDDGPKAPVQTWEAYKKNHPGRFPRRQTTAKKVG